MNDIEPKRLLGIFDKDGQKHQAGSVWDKELISPTLDTMMGGYRQPMIKDESMESLRIRKLTPKECWRLMGFKDEEFERAESAGISNTQLYRQAGNSIVVDTLVNGVFKYLFTDGELWKQEQKSTQI